MAGGAWFVVTLLGPTVLSIAAVGVAALGEADLVGTFMNAINTFPEAGLLLEAVVFGLVWLFFYLVVGALIYFVSGTYLRAFNKGLAEKG